MGRKSKGRSGQPVAPKATNTEKATTEDVVEAQVRAFRQGDDLPIGKSIRLKRDPGCIRMITALDCVKNGVLVTISADYPGGTALMTTGVLLLKWEFLDGKCCGMEVDK